MSLLIERVVLRLAWMTRCVSDTNGGSVGDAEADALDDGDRLGLSLLLGDRLGLCELLGDTEVDGLGLGLSLLLGERLALGL